MLAYLALLGVTIAVEAPLVACLARRVGASSHRSLLLEATLVNLLSHPLAFLVLSTGALPFGAVEVAVVALEAMAFRALGIDSRSALTLSAAANGATVAIALCAQGWATM